MTAKLHEKTRCRKPKFLDFCSILVSRDCSIFYVLSIGMARGQAEKPGSPDFQRR